MHVSRASALNLGGELCCLINELLPARAVLREFGPLLEVRRYACPLERLVQRMPERELWTPMRPWPADPGSEKLPRRPILRHACDVASPPELAERDVHLELEYRRRAFLAFLAFKSRNFRNGTGRSFARRTSNPMRKKIAPYPFRPKIAWRTRWCHPYCAQMRA